jgi:hypothetical protein
MTNLATWEQDAFFDPTNPNQKSYVYYSQIPGGYSSYYYNRVPTTAKLQGLGISGWSAWPVWAQALAVGAVGVALGFIGKTKVWPMVKPKLGLSGRRR